MALPKLVSPVYEIKTAVGNKTLKFVPFRVKEEKILLIAMESEDEKQIKEAILTILRNCLVSKVKPEELAIFDLEYLFLNIRAQSIGSNIDIKVSYQDDPDKFADVTIPIEDIKVKIPEGHTNIIKLSDDISLVMKYPNFEMFISENFATSDTENSTDNIFTLCIKCIDEIVEGDSIHKASDYKQEELEEFFGTLSTSQFKLIQNFISTMPKLEHTVSVVNPDTGVETSIVLAGLGSFFS